MSKGVLVPSYRKRIGYQVMLLGGMATLVSAILVLGDTRTREDIALRQAEDLRASLIQVLPESYYDNDPVADTYEIESETGKKSVIYIGRKTNKVNAVAFETSGQGYAGDIVSIMGVDINGKVLGVRVLRHAETPGLGDKIEIKRDNWILSFDGRSLKNLDESKWKVKKDGGIFDQFTGATITPRAVVNSVRDGLKLFASYKQQIVEAPLPQPEENKDE